MPRAPNDPRSSPRPQSADQADKSALASPITGQATLTDAQAKDLLAGQWYFNVHTAKIPGGEIRGQVVKSGM